MWAVSDEMDVTGLPDLALYEGTREIAGYADAEAVLRDFEAHGPERASHEFLGETILDSDGDEHSRWRREHNHLFRRNALEFYERALIVPAIERCFDELRMERGADGIVRADLVPLSRDILSDIGARLLGLGDLGSP